MLRPVRSLVLRILWMAALGAVIASGAMTQETVESLRERIIDLQNDSPLGIRRVVLSREIRSYGEYTPLDAERVPVGATVYLYIEPENLFTVRDGGRYYTEFVQDLYLIDSEGNYLIDAPELVAFSSEARSPVLDIYAENTIGLEGVPPGVYTLIVIVYDLLGGDAVEAELQFRIVGR